MSQQHLGINISESHVEFSILNGVLVRKQINREYSGKTDYDRKEAVRAIMDGEPELKEEFANVTLAWCHPKSTLVPASVFAESTPQDLFALCFGNNPEIGSIDHNRIFELSIVNVYTIPDWVKSLFVIKFPRIILQHAGTHQVRESIGSNAFYTKATLIVHADYFRLTIAKHNNLEFYSSFSYQNAEDIIYHLNFVLQQKEFLEEKGGIELSTATNGSKTVCEEVLKGLNRIQHLNKMQISIKEDLLTKSQLLCV